MEADLQTYKHVDIRDRWAPLPRRLTLRRIYVLAASLPPEASIWAIKDPKTGRLHHRPSAVELRLMEFMGMWMPEGEVHPALVQLDDAEKRARGVGAVSRATPSELAERANRYK